MTQHNQTAEEYPSYCEDSGGCHGRVTSGSQVRVPREVRSHHPVFYFLFGVSRGVLSTGMVWLVALRQDQMQGIVGKLQRLSLHPGVPAYAYLSDPIK